MRIVYKICRAAEWDAAVRASVYRGSAVDARDGFIHFSTAEQVAETATKHFAGQRDLLLIAVDADALCAALKWEPSRGGALFPHLYGDLPVSAALWVKPLPLGSAGRHILPPLAARLDASGSIPPIIPEAEPRPVAEGEAIRDLHHATGCAADPGSARSRLRARSLGRDDG